MTKTFYIHGFNSSAKSQTFIDLKSAIPDIECLEYDSFAPASENFNTMCSVIAKHDDVTIIASSLGGFYADTLARCFPISVILYNPSLTPDLNKYNVSDWVIADYASQIQCIQNMRWVADSRRTVIVSTDDAVVDSNETIAYLDALGTSYNLIETTGGHRMTAENMEIVANEWKYRTNQL